MTEPIAVAPLDELPEGRGVVVEAPGARIAVFRFGDAVYAVGDRCSHAEASLAEGETGTDDRTVECPRHGAEFDLATGAVRTLPATRPIPVYRTEVIEGDVYLYLDPEEPA